MTTIPPRSQRPFGVDDASTDAEGSTFELLADRRRRRVLQSLADRGRPTTLADLANEIASREAESEMNAVSDHAGVPPGAVRRVRISLHHVHVPKLAAANAVDYDRETDAVALCDRGRALLSRVDAICGSPPL